MNPEIGMDQLYSLWDTAFAWAMAQPILIQIALGIALLAVAYFLYVMIATTIAAFYATFFR